MIYKIVRHDKESDDITDQSFSSYDEAYDLLEEIYSDVCCSDADYEDPMGGKLVLALYVITFQTFLVIFLDPERDKSNLYSRSQSKEFVVIL